jgi:hypothetical protein
MMRARTTLKISFVMMLLSLLLQGGYFWARDAVTPDLPARFFFFDVIWVVALCSLAFYWRFPWVTLLCGWGLLFTVTVVLWQFHFQHTMVSLLLMSSAALSNVFFAHLGLYLTTLKL